MNMEWYDWSIVFGLLVFITIAALRTRKYTKSVADFLSANRCAGRYLLSISLDTVGMGAISVILAWEVFCKAGFTMRYWMTLSAPIGLFLSLSGFVFYRYRQTRALTMAQFFEMRYSHKFRIFAGILCFVSGLINFGIFPRIGAEFFMRFCQLSSEVPLNLLGFEFLLPTYYILVLVLVGIALFFTFVGGQIAVLVTDFWQGFFATFVFIAVVVFFAMMFSWSELREGLIVLSKPGNSMVDPFQIKDRPEFGISYFLILFYIAIYQCGAWQGSSAYMSSAITAHEAKMAPIVGALRTSMISAGMILIPLAAIAYLNLPKYAEGAKEVMSELHQTYPVEYSEGSDGETTDKNEHVRFRMMVPTFLSKVAPAGLIGAFTAVMLGFFISTNNTYLHSWGTIFIQDVVCPLRKKPLTNKQHLRLLRLSIVFVAVFIIVFSWTFELRDYIFMFFQITGAIFLGGAGAVIIGGLYWKRGTTHGAWAAMIIGAVMALGFIGLDAFTDFTNWMNRIFPIWTWNGVKYGFVAGICAASGYVLISLFGPKHVANMDKLLHRGKYAVKQEEEAIKERVKEEKPVGWFWRKIGVNSHEFTAVDKGLFLWTFINAGKDMVAFFVLLGLAIIGFMTPWRWIGWWGIMIIIYVVTGAVGVVWLSIGGLFDLRRMGRMLSERRRNLLDDGRVVDGHLLADEAVQYKEEQQESEVASSDSAQGELDKYSMDE